MKSGLVTERLGAQMPVGGISDNRYSARCRGRAVVQVFVG